jgi:hypothetical protein
MRSQLCCIPLTLQPTPVLGSLSAQNCRFWQVITERKWWAHFPVEIAASYCSPPHTQSSCYQHTERTRGSSVPLITHKIWCLSGGNLLACCNCLLSVLFSSLSSPIILPFFLVHLYFHPFLPSLFLPLFIWSSLSSSFCYHIHFQFPP